MSYSILREKIEQAGLLLKSPQRYVPYFIGIMGSIALGLWVITQTDRLFILILDAVFLGFVFAQSAFLGHDLAHTQVFRSSFYQRVIGTLWFSAIFGGSMRWWTGKHDLHHAHPNELGVDPDVEVPFSFSHEHLNRFRGLYALFVHYQRALFFFILSFARASVFWGSIKDFFRNHDRIAMVEALLLILHFALYFSFVFSALPFATALFFVLIVFWVQSINLGLSFAPNHKGMALLSKDTTFDFITRQTMTARNIRPSAFTDFFYGGLNYQIEHHLFPTVPRYHLRRTREIIKEFCGVHGFAYHEVGPLKSLHEIYQAFYQ